MTAAAPRLYRGFPTLRQFVAFSIECYFEYMEPPTIQPISPEQFLAWVTGQEERFELVEG